MRGNHSALAHRLHAACAKPDSTLHRCVAEVAHAVRVDEARAFTMLATLDRARCLS
jgi:hypothetical protein